MTHMPGVARGAVEHSAVEDDPTAHSGRDDHSHEIPLAAGSSHPTLSEGQGFGVVLDHGRKPGRVRDSVTERKTPPRRDVEGRNACPPSGHRSTAADATHVQAPDGTDSR
jgi:hypothetical protein